MNCRQHENIYFVGCESCKLAALARIDHENSVTNMVNHPPHYTFGKIEVIDVLEDWNLNFHKANAVKYIARAGKKDPDKEIQDLEKAVWYLKRNIELLSKNK